MIIPELPDQALSEGNRRGHILSEELLTLMDSSYGRPTKNEWGCWVWTFKPNAGEHIDKLYEAAREYREVKRRG